MQELVQIIRASCNVVHFMNSVGSSWAIDETRTQRATGDGSRRYLFHWGCMRQDCLGAWPLEHMLVNPRECVPNAARSEYPATGANAAPLGWSDGVASTCWAAVFQWLWRLQVRSACRLEPREAGPTNVHDRQHQGGKCGSAVQVVMRCEFGGLMLRERAFGSGGQRQSGSGCGLDELGVARACSGTFGRNAECRGCGSKPKWKHACWSCGGVS